MAVRLRSAQSQLEFLDAESLYDEQKYLAKTVKSESGSNGT